MAVRSPSSVVRCMWLSKRVAQDDPEQLTTDYGLRTAFSSSFIVHCFRALLCLFERGAFVVCGDTVVFVSPVAEVDQFAALGAERAVRVIFPLDGLFASWAFLHKALTTGKGKWVKGKVEAVRNSSLLPLPFTHFPFPLLSPLRPSPVRSAVAAA